MHAFFALISTLVAFASAVPTLHRTLTTYALPVSPADFQITGLATHSTSTSYNSTTGEYCVSFTVRDPQYKGTDGQTTCEYSFTDLNNYFVPTYTPCANDAFQFRIEDGTLHDLQNFQLGIEHTYENDPPYYTSFFSRGNVLGQDLTCQRSGNGTRCQQLAPDIYAQLYAMVS